MGAVAEQEVFTTEQVAESFKVASEADLVFSILGISGHERVVWNKRIMEQMKEAQAKFYELLDKGYAIFAVREEDGKKDSRMLQFDPNSQEFIAEFEHIREVVAVPPVIGG